MANAVLSHSERALPGSSREESANPETPESLATSIEQTLTPLTQALDHLRQAAATKLAEREDAWRSHALALAKTDDLPPDIARRVIPGLCREALEAACMETVRRRPPYFAALALFDDMDKAGEVMTRINRDGGRPAPRSTRRPAEAIPLVRTGVPASSFRCFDLTERQRPIAPN